MNATTAPPSPPPVADRATAAPDVRPHEEPGLATATVSIAFGAAGLLPVLPFVGSLVAVVLGGLALHDAGDAPATRARARIGLTLGIIGVAAPLIALVVYCGVLGYPFPIHRYRPSG